MTAYDYSKIQATALRLIERFGRAATISRLTPGTGPAHNPGAGSTASHSCRALVEEYSSFERDGKMIQVGDRKVSIPAKGLSTEPAPGDKYADADGTFTVVSVKALAPGPTRLVFTLQVRR